MKILLFYSTAIVLEVYTWKCIFEKNSTALQLCFVGKKCKTDFVSLTELQKSSCAFDDCLHLFGFSLNPKFNTDKSRLKKPLN